jgi:hypothetical protein
MILLTLAITKKFLSCGGEQPEQEGLGLRSHISIDGVEGLQKRKHQEHKRSHRRNERPCRSKICILEAGILHMPTAPVIFVHVI